MYRQCETCQRCYDDVTCWTICPHGPLWAPVDAYDPKTDLVTLPSGPGAPVTLAPDALPLNTIPTEDEENE